MGPKRRGRRRDPWRRRVVLGLTAIAAIGLIGYIAYTANTAFRSRAPTTFRSTSRTQIG